MNKCRFCGRLLPPLNDIEEDDFNTLCKECFDEEYDTYLEDTEEKMDP